MCVECLRDVSRTKRSKRAELEIRVMDPVIRNPSQATILMAGDTSEVYRNDTHGEVYSHRLSYYLKVRKGGDFFYGKSSNENYT